MLWHTEIVKSRRHLSESHPSLFPHSQVNSQMGPADQQPNNCFVLVLNLSRAVILSSRQWNENVEHGKPMGIYLFHNV